MNANLNGLASTRPALSDAELAHRAQAALSWNRSLPPGGVTANVATGWLTLSGEVWWHYQRQDAAECVRHLRCLAGISNCLVLHPPVNAAGAKAVP